MKTVLKIIRKDLAHRWILAAVTALVIVFYDSFPFAGIQFDGPGSTTRVSVLAPLKWILVVATTVVWIQDDSFSEGPVFWRTRPIGRTALVFGKWLGLAVVVILPALAAVVIAAIPLHPFPQVWWALLSTQGLRYLTVVVIVSTFAASARTFSGAMASSAFGMALYLSACVDRVIAAALPNSYELVRVFNERISTLVLICAGILLFNQSFWGRNLLNRLLLFLSLVVIGGSTTESRLRLPFTPSAWSPPSLSHYTGKEAVCVQLLPGAGIAYLSGYSRSYGEGQRYTNYGVVTSHAALSGDDDMEWVVQDGARSTIKDRFGHVDRLVPAFGGTFAAGPMIGSKLRALGYRTHPKPWQVVSPDKNPRFPSQVALFLLPISDQQGTAFRPTGTLSARVILLHARYRSRLSLPLAAGASATDRIGRISILTIGRYPNGGAELQVEGEGLSTDGNYDGSWLESPDTTLVLANDERKEFCMTWRNGNRRLVSNTVLCRSRELFVSGELFGLTGTLGTLKAVDADWLEHAHLVVLQTEHLGYTEHSATMPDFVLHNSLLPSAHEVPHLAPARPAAPVDPYDEIR